MCIQGCNCRSPCQLTGLAIFISKNKKTGIFYYVYYLRNNDYKQKHLSILCLNSSRGWFFFLSFFFFFFKRCYICGTPPSKFTEYEIENRDSVVKELTTLFYLCCFHNQGWVTGCSGRLFCSVDAPHFMIFNQSQWRHHKIMGYFGK